MFLFIHVPRGNHVIFCVIQIHLMFLFIFTILLSSRFMRLYSNTSHVLIYHRKVGGAKSSYHNSNTSHVLIYQILMQLDKQSLLHSNTSHVLIYLDLLLFAFAPNSFKYISCSYLSRVPGIHLIRAASFKYISCSYLSLTRSQGLSQGINSNTSHVLIYRSTFYLFLCRMPIQIHLMFLFIRNVS